MLNWLAQNAATIILSIVLITAVAMIIIHLVKNKKKGKTSCGCGCQNCPMSGSCHSKK